MMEDGRRRGDQVTAGTWLSLQVTLAPMAVPRGHMRPLAAAVREAVDVPVMAVGRLDDPALTPPMSWPPATPTWCCSAAG